MMSGVHVASTLPDESEGWTHDSVYYLKDGVIFLVGQQLFKIPRHMLEITSPVFADLFSLPIGEDGAEGNTDTKPIRLEQVDSVDFQRLLAFLYPLTTQYETFTDSWRTDEWRSILRLAAKWDMAEIQTKAINRLEQLGCFPSPLEKIFAGWEYGHAPWVRQGFLGLIRRNEPLSQEEGGQLGLEYTIKCATAREASLRERLRQAQARNSYSGFALPVKTDQQVLDEVFGAEILLPRHMLRLG